MEEYFRAETTAPQVLEQQVSHIRCVRQSPGLSHIYLKRGQLEKTAYNLILSVQVHKHGLSQLPGKTVLISVCYLLPLSLESRSRPPWQPSISTAPSFRACHQCQMQIWSSPFMCEKSTALARFDHLLTCLMPTSAQRNCLRNMSMNIISMMDKDNFSGLSRNFSLHTSFPNCIGNQAKRAAV